MLALYFFAALKTKSQLFLNKKTHKSEQKGKKLFWLIGTSPAIKNSFLEISGQRE